MSSVNNGPSSSSQANVTAVLEAAAVAAPPIKRLVSLGDSLSLASAALGASSISNMYMRKLSALLGVGADDANGPGAPNAATFVEAAISGVNSQRYINALNRDLAMTANDLVCGIPLFNTMRGLAPNPAFIHELALQLAGTLAWLAIPESAKIRSILRGTTTANPALTLAGTWAYFAMTVGTDLNGLDLRSASGTSTATFPAVTGDTVYVWYARSTTSEAFTIIIDGVSYPVGGAISYTTWLDAGLDWEMCLLRVTGLTNGPHTVVASRGSGAANIIAAAGFDSATIAANAPRMVLGNIPPMITGTAAQGYAFAGSVSNDPLSALQDASASGTLTGTINIPYMFGHAGIQTWNATLSAVVQMLQADGLRVDLVDIFSELMPTNDVSADFVHFNDSGNEKIFRRMRKELV